MDAYDPRYKKLIELAMAFDVEWHTLGMSLTDRVMGFTKDNRSYKQGVEEGRQQMREAFLKANGML